MNYYILLLPLDVHDNHMNGACEGNYLFFQSE